MLNDAAILEYLKKELQPAELSLAVRRLRLVPEVWSALGNADFLKHVLQFPGELDWTPAAIADSCLMFDSSRTKEDLDSDGGLISNSLVDLFELGRAAHELAGEINEIPDEPSIDFVSAPSSWTSRLCCAWPHIEKPASLIEHMLSYQNIGVTKCLLTSLRANLADDELFDLLGKHAGHLAHAIPALVAGGERDLALFLVEYSPGENVDHGGSPTAHADEMHAYAQALGGDFEAAHNALSSEWEKATEATASVADRLGDIARLEKNQAIELEARRKAVEEASSPMRRAAFARVLVEVGQAYDASQVVSQTGIVEERIACGMALLGQGLKQQARIALVQASREIFDLGYDDPIWLDWLAKGLEACGALAETIEAKSLLARLLPHNAELESDLAALWDQSGDPAKAVLHAEMALAMAPTSASARKSLATYLRHNGESARALGFYRQVVEDDESLLVEYCECALETDQHGLAGEIASKLVERDPQSSTAQTLFARAKHIEGHHEIARAAVQRAIEIDAAQAGPWLVLAEIQTASGEDDAAGETLQKALEVAPEDGRTHYARSQWLASKDRYHEASEHLARAIELNPSVANWIVDHADLLTRVGDLTSARDQLERALDLQPMNWRARANLALNLEGTAELERAAKLVAELPLDVDDNSRIDAGRILVKLGLTGNGLALKKGIANLEAAQAQPEQKADLLYWSARAYEAQGESARASRQYKSYLDEFDHLVEHHLLEAVLGYARVSLELEKPGQAITFLELNRERFPGSLDIVRALAESHLADGAGSKAFEIAQEAIRLNPVSIEAHKLVSKTAEAQGDIRTAIDAELEVIAQQPEYGSNWGRLATLYARVNDLPTARGHLAKAILIDRKDPLALQHLAQMSGEFGLINTQMRLMKRAGSQAPDDAGLNRDLAELAEHYGDYETAYAAWMCYLKQEPSDIAAIKRAASAVSKTSGLSTAIELWKQVLEQEPEEIESLSAMARALDMMGDPQASLQYYQKLLDAGVEDAEILSACAKAFLDYGEPERAQSIIERTVHQHPDHTGIQLVQVEAMLSSGQAQRALDLLEKLIEQAPTDAYILGLAALSSVMLGDIQRAKAGMEEALHEAHLSIEATTVLMHVCAALGEWRIHSTLLQAQTNGYAMHASEARRAICAVLRARDLEWLHAEILAVNANKPDAQSIHRSLERWRDQRPDDDGRDDDVAALYVNWLGNFEIPVTLEETVMQKLTRVERQDLIQASAMGFINANRPNKALSLLEDHPPDGLHQGYHALLTAIAAKQADQSARSKDAAVKSTTFVETRACGSYLRGKQALIDSDIEGAITAYNAALAIWPDEAAWHAELAHIYTRSSRHEAALPHLQQAAELDPQNLDHMLALARALRASGELSDAEAMYARCLQNGSPSVQVWKEAGEVAIANGNASQAESWFERACSLAPSDALCMMGSAKAALIMGQQKQAFNRAQSAYKLAPNEPEVLTGFAEILEAQGKTEKALQAYDRAIKISAGDHPIQLARSRLLLKSGQYSDAINDIRGVLEADDRNPDAWALLSKAHEGATRLDEALEAIQKALAEAPRSGSYRLSQGRIYRKTGQLDQALKVLRELEQEEPETAELQGELGKVYEARRETDLALEAFLRAVAIDPGDFESSMQAGLILKGLKSYEHAAEMFEHVVASRPNDAKALHQLAAVRALQLVHGGIETQVVST